MSMGYTRCPKCGHTPLPSSQAFPAKCPDCGVIFAKIGQRPSRKPPAADSEPGWTARLLDVPQRVDGMLYWLRVALLAGLAVWGVVLIRLDYRIGEIGDTFLHRPLLVFHEAGHVVFMPFGETLMMLGGTFGQLLMPLLMAGALLVKNRDPFGASVGMWFFGVSLMDVAPYMYDALHPKLMLLSGRTGEAGGHDWIFLFTSAGLLPKAQTIGGLTHKLGALVLLLSLLWAGMLLVRQYARRGGDVLQEE